MKEVPRPSTEGAKPPAAFDDIILRALERDPEKRFATAQEMADALRTAAATSGLLVVKHKVARWVADSFAEDLERRRKAIKEVAARRANPNETPVNVLARLPAIASTTTISGDVSSVPGSDSGLGSKGSARTTAGREQLERTEHRRHHARFGDRSITPARALRGRRDDRRDGGDRGGDLPGFAEQDGAERDGCTRTGDGRCASAFASRRPRRLAPGAEEQGAQAQGDAARDDAGVLAKPGRALLPGAAGPGRHLVGPVRPGAIEPAREATRVEPKEVPAKPAPAAPMPTPAQTEDFEKNPYLRR